MPADSVSSMTRDAGWINQPKTKMVREACRLLVVDDESKKRGFQAQPETLKERSHEFRR